MRGRWHHLALRLLRLSYVLGVAEALPTHEELERFLAPVRSGESVETVAVWLDAPGKLEVPPGAGAVELDVGFAGSRMARVRAINAAGQWDWREVTERVVSAASEPLRRAALLGGPGWARGEDGSAPPFPPAPAPDASPHGRRASSR